MTVRKADWIIVKTIYSSIMVGMVKVYWNLEKEIILNRQKKTQMGCYYYREN